ncbi:MAG TPA: ion channel [Solirubrobacteraceae bacterium]|jgi:voltage-gated potassium channel|nr:ion channel [Solirubrobacteraceae bacterium]
MPLFLVAARLVRRIGRYRVYVLIGLAGVIILVGAALFSACEHVSYGIGLYWSVTTATTVGYGDVTPHNSAGRVIAAGVMLTTIPIVGAVFALVAGTTVLTRLRRLLGMDSKLPSTPYTIVYGAHPVLARVLDELAHTGDPVVLVAPDRPANLDDDVCFLVGDPTDEALIRRSDPARANRALIACTSDADTLVLAVAIHGLAPDLELYALTQSRAVARALHELGVKYTLASDELVGHTLAKSLETPQAGDLLLQLVDTTTYRLAESGVDQALVSQPLSRARAASGTLVLGIARGGHVDLGVGDDPILSADDRLIVLEALAPAH